jgi:hypothetical protein
MGAKLSSHSEQWFGQSITIDTDVNRPLKFEQRDKQSQSVATYLELMRVSVVVEDANHAEELYEV